MKNTKMGLRRLCFTSWATPAL